MTGPNAQYGTQWKQGFDLALDEINASGIDGRKLAYSFEDSQSDPRQSVAIAQKFVSDPKIVMELGDFSSPASMAASPIHQRAGLVQFGFTNSHPDFTKGGDFMWSTSVSQADEQPLLARYAEGLAAYRARRWDDARRAFQAALEAVPGDGPSMAMAERVEKFRANPPPADWDGEWQLDQK